MRRHLHNPIVMWLAIAVFIGLPVLASFTAKPFTIGWVSSAIREIAPWQACARVNPDLNTHTYSIVVRRPDGSLVAFEEDDPPVWARSLDWWGKDDGLDKWQAYDVPRSRSAIPGLILEIATVDRHTRDVWAITGAPVPTDAELLALANARAGSVNQWNDSWSDRVAADGLIRIDKRVGFFLNPISLATDLLWLLSPLVATDAWRHRYAWPSRLRDSSTCPKCGYDLSATPDKPCPECGLANS